MSVEMWSRAAFVRRGRSESCDNGSGQALFYDISGLLMTSNFDFETEHIWFILSFNLPQIARTSDQNVNWNDADVNYLKLNYIKYYENQIYQSNLLYWIVQ